MLYRYMEFTQVDVGRVITCPCSFFGYALPQRAEKQRFIRRFHGDADKDTGWKTMTLAGGKDQGFKIIREEWPAH
jgi:hypothetical protein